MDIITKLIYFYQNLTPVQADPYTGKKIIILINTVLIPEEIPVIRVYFVEAYIDNTITNRAILNNRNIINLIFSPFAK